MNSQDNERVNKIYQNKDPNQDMRHDNDNNNGLHDENKPRYYEDEFSDLEHHHEINYGDNYDYSDLLEIEHSRLRKDKDPINRDRRGDHVNNQCWGNDHDDDSPDCWKVKRTIANNSKSMDRDYNEIEHKQSIDSQKKERSHRHRSRRDRPERYRTHRKRDRKTNTGARYKGVTYDKHDGTPKKRSSGHLDRYRIMRNRKQLRNVPDEYHKYVKYDNSNAFADDLNHGQNYLHDAHDIIGDRLRPNNSVDKRRRSTSRSPVRRTYLEENRRKERHISHEHDERQRMGHQKEGSPNSPGRPSGRGRQVYRSPKRRHHHYNQNKDNCGEIDEFPRDESCMAQWFDCQDRCNTRKNSLYNENIEENRNMSSRWNQWPQSSPRSTLEDNHDRQYSTDRAFPNDMDYRQSLLPPGAQSQKYASRQIGERNETKKMMDFLIANLGISADCIQRKQLGQPFHDVHIPEPSQALMSVDGRNYNTSGNPYCGGDFSFLPNYTDSAQHVQELLNLLFEGGGRLTFDQLQEKVDINVALNKLIQENGGLFEILEKHNDIFSLSYPSPVTVVTVYTKLKVCENHSTKQGCHNLECKKIHICKFHLISLCEFQKTGCSYGHSFDSNHNLGLLREHGLGNLNGEKLKVVFKHNRSKPTTPLVCRYYNTKIGCKSPNGKKCHALHVCKFYIEGTCTYGDRCLRSHDILDDREILMRYGIDTETSHASTLCQLQVMMERVSEDDETAKPHQISKSVWNASSAYLPAAIVAETTPGKPGLPVTSSATPTTSAMPATSATPAMSTTPATAKDTSSNCTKTQSVELEICSINLSGKCKSGSECKNVHAEKQYLWQYMEVGGGWTNFSNNEIEDLELNYSDPAQDCCFLGNPLKPKIIRQVDFDDMTIVEGLANIGSVRRLATKSSVTAPDMYNFSTCWRWYFQDKQDEWHEYKINNKNKRQKISSNRIEREFQKNVPGKLNFTLRKRSYKIDLRAMKQEDLKTGEESAVRRRPQYPPLSRVCQEEVLDKENIVTADGEIKEEPPVLVEQTVEVLDKENIVTADEEIKEEPPVLVEQTVNGEV